MAEESTNVVQLASHKADTTADHSHLLARLPAPFMAMKDKGKQALQPLLQSLFDNIDDALFEMADKAEVNAEQNMFFESMREIRIKRRGMELGFGKGIDLSLVQLFQPTDEPPTLSDEAKVSTENWTLVKDDELEELVAVDNMIAKAEREFSLELKQLTGRLDLLTTNQAVTIKNNPFGPATTCRIFLDVCKSLELDIKAKLVLFKLFDRYVMKSLGKVYKAANDALIAGGIQPNLEQSSAQASPTSDSYGADTYGAGGDVASDTAQSPQQDVFADLQQLLHRHVEANRQPASRPTLPQSGLVAPGLAPQIPRNTLMQLLQAVQQSLMSDMDRQLQAALQGQGPQHLDIQQSLNSLLSVKMPAKALSIGQVDHDAINLVAMLFQFILDDRNMAPPMKALIARLQIPIIKVAMQDKSFFSKNSHPARKMLNEIANASLGWVASNNLDRDPLYQKVSKVVNRVLLEFDGDTQLFQDVLTDFVAFLEMDKRRIGLVEQRTITAEDGKAKSELARNAVQDALNEKVVGLTLPKVVITLLEDAWSNVMFLICLKEGRDGQKWQEALRVVDDLLFSVQPITKPEQRRQLLTLIPGLLKNLRTGLSKIGYDPFEMNQLFQELEAIHLDQLQAESVELDVASASENIVFKSNTSTPSPTAQKSTTAHNAVGKQKQIAKQSQAIEQTLDQLLESRGAGSVSLEELDAELDRVLDQQLEVPEPEVKPTSKIERQTVEKLVVSGSSEEQGAQVELEESDPSLQAVDSLKTGCWVELHQDEGKKTRCRLAAVIRATSKYVFVNRQGMKVAEYTRMSLAVALKAGKVTTLDEGSLFDRALESVIGNLREMKSGSS